MFERILDLEARLDREFPRPRLRGKAPPALIALSREWSEEVWRTAKATGPTSITAGESEAGLELARHPVFVCGVHRSGTTLVRDLLDGHPALSVLPSEGGFLTNHERHLERLTDGEAQTFLGCEWIRRLANPINQPPYWSIGRSTPIDSPSVDFARAFLAWWAVVEARLSRTMSSWPLVVVALAYASHGAKLEMAAGVRQWVEKTPTNERFLQRLWKDFPDAKVLHVVRDPIDVVASRKSIEERATGRFRSLGTVLYDLAVSYRVAVEQLARPEVRRYLLVRYEDLVVESRPAVDRIAAFLGIEPRSSLLEPTVAGVPASSNSSFDVGDASGTIVAAGARARISTLTAAERVQIAATIGKAAAALGYAVAV